MRIDRCKGCGEHVNIASDHAPGCTRTATAPKLLNAICHIGRCKEPARYNFITQGHPNGDVAVAYCHNHATMTPGHWDDSPTPYSITITGPFEAAK